MAANINLVEYQSDDDENLYETKVELIESSYISSSLLNKLLQSFPLVERNVYEEIGSEENYSIECFENSDVEEIIKALEDVFLSILSCDSEKLLGGHSSKSSETLPALFEQHINANDINESINRFRTLTNVIYLFKLKQNQYGKNVSVVIKIG